MDKYDGLNFTVNAREKMTIDIHDGQLLSLIGRKIPILYL